MNDKPRDFIGYCDYWGRPCPKNGECDCIVDDEPEPGTDDLEDEQEPR